MPKSKPAGLIDIKKHKKSKKEIEARIEAEKELNVGTDKIECPEWLVNEIAINEWDRVVQELIKIDLITNVDVTILANYCQAYSLYVQAVETLQDGTLFIEYTNKFGSTNTIEHPAVNTQKKNFEIILKCASELGLTPSARAKLAIKKIEKKEPSKTEKMFGSV